MTGLHQFGTSVVCVLLFAPPLAGQNLDSYRDFAFGMRVESVVKQTQAEPGSTKTIHTAPDLIQTLQWNRQSYFSPSTEGDAVRSIRFDFYNDQLFRIVAIYARQQIEGMTADDLIDAISKVYGPSSRPDESVVVSAYTNYEERQQVLARWENGANTYSLFRSSYGGDFGLVAYSKKLDVLAANSIREAERLEVLSAPQREIERQRKEADDRRVSEEKARAVNKPNFRP